MVDNALSQTFNFSLWLSVIPFRFVMLFLGSLRFRQRSCRGCKYSGCDDMMSGEEVPAFEGLAPEMWAP